ncbi:hypothetical protein [Paraburkholderia sp. BCC1884]|uniref:hypothetical protein n=1 Tax=Paraburkholderia sp. BCC1884 TaxID=2562668 RepID=UPI0011825C70|nr:hypothetical protein [Paraburkholderia sp. BCC1884]
MPASGLDASWGYALNEAIAHHLIFGRDLVFTYGPLGTAFTHMYHPQTDGLMLVASTVLSLALCAGFAILALPQRPLTLLLLPIVLATAQSPDATFVAIPFCLLIATFVTIDRSNARPDRTLPKSVSVALIFIAAACGLLPLVKGSFVAVTLFLCFCSALLLAIARHTKLAITILVAVLASMPVCWTVVGQPLAALPHFFIAQLPIISGYAGAMSSPGSYLVVALWLLLALAGLGVVHASLSRGRGRAGLVLSVGVLGYLFITFKASFVRQDDGHLYTALAAMSFLALTLIMSVRMRVALVYAVLTMAVWSAIEVQTNHFHPVDTMLQPWRAFQRLHAGLDARLDSQNRLHADFDEANARIRAAFPIAKIEGSVDIYPTELAPIFAYGLTWSGRPVPQSYSAYTPSLDLLDANHLRGASGPQNVFYSTDSIDGRLPSLEDASSLPIFLTQYRVVGKREEVLQMSRLPQTHAVDFRKLAERDEHLNEAFDVPRSADPVVASIVMTPTLLGKLTAAVFKLPRLYIETVFDDGTVRQNRFIPGMAANGFVVAPYVGSVDAVVEMAAGISTMKVKQIRIVGGELGLWRKTIHVVFSSFAVNPQDAAIAMAGFTAQSSPPAALHEVSSTTAACYLESVNGTPKAKFPAGNAETGNTATIVGWASPSTDKGLTPDEIWLAATSPDGAEQFYKAQITDRSDVGAFFHHPEMANVGFKVKLREAAPGAVTMRVLTIRDGVAQDCGIGQRVTFVNQAGGRGRANAQP